MDYKVKWTKTANHKLYEIVAYLADNWSKEIVDTFVNKVFKIIDLLTKFPELGQVQLKDKKIRAVVITKQVRLYYRVSRKTIILLNFIDVRMNK
jgi:plasmid stabilization system protein ParE